MTRQGAEEQQALWKLEAELSTLLAQHHSTFWTTYRSLDGWPEEPDERFLDCVYETLAEFLVTKLRSRQEDYMKSREISRFARKLERNPQSSKSGLGSQ